MTVMTVMTAMIPSSYRLTVCMTVDDGLTATVMTVMQTVIGFASVFAAR